MLLTFQTSFLPIILFPSSQEVRRTSIVNLPLQGWERTHWGEEQGPLAWPPLPSLPLHAYLLPWTPVMVARTQGHREGGREGGSLCSLSMRQDCRMMWLRSRGRATEGAAGWGHLSSSLILSLEWLVIGNQWNNTDHSYCFLTLRTLLNATLKNIFFSFVVAIS